MIIYNINMNDLECLLELYPKKNWCGSYIMANPGLSYETIMSWPEEKRKYGISSNPNTPWEVIKVGPGMKWNMGHISMNTTWDIIKSNPDIEWNWDHVSCNPNITWDIIKDNPDKPWNYEHISSNPNITWDIILSNIDKNWTWWKLSKHPNITWDIIQANLKYPWVWQDVSNNPNITWDIIQANPNIEWSYGGILSNPSITWDIIKTIIHKPKYVGREHCVSMNPNITWKIVRDNPDFKWDWSCLSFNEFIYNKTSARYKYYMNTMMDILSIFFTEKGISRIIINLII